jgi:5-methylcytosine-specific restriction endonuclease McrA
MRFDNLRTLVLTQNFMPVSVFPDLWTISVKVAIAGYLNNTCEVVEFYDRPIMSNKTQAIHPEKGPLFWPSVIMYKNAQNRKKIMRLTKEHLYYRDHAACVYCGDPLTSSNTTMDHMVPKSKGGAKNWGNIVASCDECNKKKGAALPTGRWTPNKKPYVPTFYDLLAARKKQPLIVDDPSWLPFLPKWEAEIIVRTGHQKPLESKDAFLNDNEDYETLEKSIRKAQN